MRFFTSSRRHALVAVVLLLSLSHGVAVVGGKRTVRPVAPNSQSLASRGTLKSWDNGNEFFGLRRAKGVVELQQLGKRDMECRLVHEFEDKCKFVRENCRDEEVGFFDYLEFYYCTLGNVPAVAFSIMGAWMVLLFTTIGIAASDFFCINLSTIANILGMSESMAGVTFLAFGNGSPDVFSTFAAMKINSGSLAIGELIGAASFIAAVVAGSMAIVHPFKVGKKSFVRDVSFFVVAVLFGIFFLADGKIEMWECLVMIMFYVSYVFFVVVWHWMSQRRKQKRRKERNAREHYLVPEEEELFIDEDDEDGGVGAESEGLPGAPHDFSALERGTLDDEDDAEEQEQAAYASFSNNMRIQRPQMERSMTPATPHNIRPSLVGALEFRAVLHLLEKNRNLAGRPIHLRRYSDDPFLSVSASIHSAPGSLINAPTPSIPLHQHARDHTGRLRAVSVNDAPQATMAWNKYKPTQPTLPGVKISSPKSARPTQLQPDIAQSPSPRTTSLGLLALPTPHGHQNVANPSPSISEPTTPLIPTSSSTLLVPTSPGTGSETSSLHVFESPRVTSSHSVSPPGSIRLPPPSLDSMSLGGLSGTGQSQWRHVEWWPYEYLPPPQLLYATLFPTLRGFRDKTPLEKSLAVVAMLPVFLLTITLPVVEAGGTGGGEKRSDTPIVVLEPDSPTAAPPVTGTSGIGPKTWNRWLVATQCLTAPVFLVVMFAWDDDPDTSLMKPVLYAMIVGLVCLAGLLVLTRPERAPRGRYLLCFAGFAVSIGWISAIANEVVGVLKAFGVVLGISDAILGLTIFAVGNSLGDLVADITVARLGFPVMALSACFGGPMLNILLGIGISGLYITLSRTDHEAYRIEVSSTLVISAATLLTTLVLLLVAVPLNSWYMSRRIGWTLITLWGVSTIVNLAVEVSGVGGKWGSVRGG